MNRKKETLRLLLAALLVLLALRVRAEPAGDGPSALDRAREAATADRHLDAVRLYKKAISMQPSLRTTVATELGHQYTWAEMPDSAISWYRIAIGANAGDMEANLGLARAMSWAGRLDEAAAYYHALLENGNGGRSEALLGLARVRSWQGDLDEAERLYRDVKSRDPDETEALIGLAEVTNWAGRHREAARLYAQALDEDPANTEARAGLAYAQYWSGRQDRALETLRAGAGNGDLDRAARAIRGGDRIDASHVFAYRDNSTDGNQQLFTTRADFVPAPQVEAEVSFAKGRLDQSGFPEIDRDEVTATLTRRLSGSIGVTLSPGVQWNRFDNVAVPVGSSPVDDFNLFVWDAYVTLAPADWVRADVGNSRQILDIPQVIFRRIRVTSTGAGIDWRVRRRFKTYWTLKFDDYSDSNSRFAFAHRSEWTPRVPVAHRWRNAFTVSGGIEYTTFDEQFDHGYFSPRTYLQPYAGLRFGADLSPRVHLDVSGRLGAEKENGEGWVSVGTFEGAARVRLGGNVALEVGYTTSGSRLDTPEGFRSKRAFVSLGYALRLHAR